VHYRERTRQNGVGNRKTADTLRGMTGYSLPTVNDPALPLLAVQVPFKRRGATGVMLVPVQSRPVAVN